MLEHDLEARQVLDELRQDPLDEHGLAVEDVDVGIGDLAMDEERHADPLHRLQRRIEGADVGHAMGGIGRGMGGIKLGGGEHPLRETPLDLAGVRSEEHTSELQSLMRISYAVFCLKKKKQSNDNATLTEKH